jgi:hypothetical protein
MIATIMYMLALHFIGMKYQVWKFTSYTILPLSFVPLALFFEFLRAKLYWTKGCKTLIGIVIIVILIPLFFSFLFPLKGFLTRTYPGYMGRPYIEVISHIKYILPPHAKIALHLSKRDPYFMTIDFLASGKLDKLSALRTFTHYQGRKEYNLYSTNPPNTIRHTDYSQILEDTDLIISDSPYDGLFNGNLSNPQNDSVYVYDAEFLRANGYVSFTGLANWSSETLGRFLEFSIRLPDDARGLPLLLQVELEQSSENGPACLDGPIKLKLTGNEANKEIDFQKIPLRISLAGDLTSGKFLYGTIVFPENYAPLPEYTATPCSFMLKEVKIEPQAQRGMSPRGTD